MAGDWKQEGERYTFDEITAEREVDDKGIVITSLGPQPDADRLFAAILAARPLGAISLRVTGETKSTIEALTGDGRIKCVRAVGTEHPELGVVAIRSGPRS